MINYLHVSYFIALRFLKEIKVTYKTLAIAKQLNNGNGGIKVYLKDINIDDYEGDEHYLAYVSVKYMRINPSIGIPLLWEALHQQYDF